MRNPFRRLLPRRETYLLFARPPAPCDRTPPADIVITHITTPDHPAVQPLEPFCTAHGFPPGWPRDMLAAGAQAVVAADAATQALMAMAWLTTAPFYVEEIDHTLDPAGGVYLFGDFVAPPHRGKGLQGTLLRQRLMLSPDKIAYTIVRDDNAPSIKNYRALDFIPTTRLTHQHWSGRSRWNCQAAPGANARLPAFESRPGNRLAPVPASPD